MASQHPCIGLWYQNTLNCEVFEIVALDDYSGMIEIQYENGDVGEMEFDCWNTEQHVQVARPECSGSDFVTDSDDMAQSFEQKAEGGHWSYSLTESDLDGLGGFEGGPI